MEAIVAALEPKERSIGWIVAPTYDLADRVFREIQIIALEKILAREPGSVAALTRLSRIYERAGDWARCKGALEQANTVPTMAKDEMIAIRRFTGSASR